jgi:hypothetical protein
MPHIYFTVETNLCALVCPHSHAFSSIFSRKSVSINFGLFRTQEPLIVSQFEVNLCGRLVKYVDTSKLRSKWATIYVQFT